MNIQGLWTDDAFYWSIPIDFIQQDFSDNAFQINAIF